MKVEKSLKFLGWKIRIERGYPLDGKVLRLKGLSLYEDFQKKDGREEETKPFAANRGWLDRFRNRFNLKNVSHRRDCIGRRGSSCHFCGRVKKNIKEGKYDPRQRNRPVFFLRKCGTGHIFTEVQNRRQDLKHGRID